MEESAANLREAVEMFIESAGPSEVTGLREELYVTALEAAMPPSMEALFDRT